MSTAWVIAAACFVVYVASILAFVLRQRCRADDDEGRCGHCGYRTRGLPSSICPECGSDLNVVGLRCPTRWNRLSPPARRMIATLLWTIAVAWSAALAWAPFRQFLQPGHQSLISFQLCDSVAGPYSLVLARYWESDIWGWRRSSTPREACPFDRVVVGVNRKGVYGLLDYLVIRPEDVDPATCRKPLFVVDIVGGRYACCLPRLDEWRVDHGAGPDWKTKLKLWLTDLGEGQTYPALRNEVMAAFDELIQAPYGRPLSLLGSGLQDAGTSLGHAWIPDERYTLPFLLVWFIAWLAGVFFVARIGPRGSRRPNARQPPAGGESQVQ